MCGRTALTTSPEDLREVFGLSETPSLAPHYNVPPSQPVAVVRVLRQDRAPERRRTMETLRWGLIPAWAKDRKIGNRLALARVETASVTPAFRDALRRRRCLVVVDGFFEWKRSAGVQVARRHSLPPSRSERGKSQPFFFRREDGAPFGLAGVWERWVSGDGEVVESCAVITQPARPPVDAVHDRMPLVVEPEAWDRWLEPALTDTAAIEPMLAPWAPALVAYPVGARVNDPRNDDAECLKPHAPEEPAQRSLF